MLDLVRPRIDTPTVDLIEGDLVWITPDRTTGRTFATVRHDGQEITGPLHGFDGVMTAYNVTAKVAKEISSGKKRHKICVNRRLGHARVGERVHFFTGRGTSAARHLGEYLCTGIFPITITFDGFNVVGDFVTNGTPDQFAKSEGFFSWEEFATWISKTHDGLPADCTIVTW